MFISRLVEPLVQKYMSQFRAIAITGIRQAGKTTLIKNQFSHMPYVNLENTDTRLLAEKDPRTFIDTYQDGCIIDEAQKVPEIFSYLQQVLDESNKRGQFILTGSSNFLLNQAIGQSLAGRLGYMNLLPFSLEEIQKVQPDVSLDKVIFTGGMPEVWVYKIDPKDFFRSYILTFLEKDIRNLSNISNLAVFQQFLELCAVRTAQEWNATAVSNELGIDVKTVQSWLGLLKISGIAYTLQPYTNNFGKRVIQRPKLYLADTGLVCNMLRITSELLLNTHPLKGAIFENWVVLEILKLISAEGPYTNLYYWRAVSSIEVDLVIERNGKLIPVEIKSSMTLNENWWKNLEKWGKLATNSSPGIIIYNGPHTFNYSDGRKLVRAIDIKNLFTII